MNIVYLFILSLLGCIDNGDGDVSKNKMNNGNKLVAEKINGSGLSGKEEINDLLISQDNSIYFGGKNSYHSNSPIIASSNDNGNKWDIIYSGGNGEIIRIHKKKEYYMQLIYTKKMEIIVPKYWLRTMKEMIGEKSI